MIAFAILFAACFIMVPYVLAWRTRRRSAAARLTAQMDAIRNIACLAALAGFAVMALSRTWLGAEIGVLLIGFALVTVAVDAAARAILGELAKTGPAPSDATPVSSAGTNDASHTRERPR